MTAFFFAMCYWYVGDVFHTARCTYVTKAECEAVFDECHAGWVKTPIFRRTK